MCPPSELSHGIESPSQPDDSDQVDVEPELVVVIDSSTIIQIKRKVHTDDQWPLFEQMLKLVKEGQLVFPSQVHREISRERHPDMPGAWCGTARKHLAHPDPSDVTLVEILHVVEKLVDQNAEPDREPADPYVAAMAFELTERGYDVAVATDDCVDRLPLKIALTTACEALEITTWDCEAFLGWVGGTMTPEDGQSQV